MWLVLLLAGAVQLHVVPAEESVVHDQRQRRTYVNDHLHSSDNHSTNFLPSTRNIDSNVDRAHLVYLSYTPTVATQLFADCLPPDHAFVRYYELTFPSRATYTRYVPSADQVTLYASHAWRPAGKPTIASALKCAAFADRRAAMMFRYNNGVCEVTDLRIPEVEQSCDDSVDAVFIRTSCVEPSVILTLTAGYREVNATWTVDDPCDIMDKFQLIRTEDATKQVLDKKIRSYTYVNLEACENLGASLVALDRYGASYATASTNSTTTLLEHPSVVNLTFTTPSEGSLMVSWVIHDPCSVAPKYQLDWVNDVRSANGSISLAANVSSYTISGRPGCENITVTLGLLNATDDSPFSGSEKTEVGATRSQVSGTKLLGARITIGFGHAKVSWDVIDNCNLIKSFVIDGLDFDTTEVIYEDIAKCSRLVVDIDGVDIDGVSVVESPVRVVGGYTYPSATACNESAIEACSHCARLIRAPLTPFNETCSNLYSATRGDPKELRWLRKKLNGYADFNPWINLQDLNGTSNYTYENGDEEIVIPTDGTASNWATGEPSAPSKCVFMSAADDYKLRVANCSELHGSICITAF